MKIAIASDIHREFNPAWGEMDDVREEADIFVFAGDIDTGISGLEWAESLEVPAFYVMGNHEFYQSVYEKLKKEAQEFSDDADYVTLLDHHVIIEEGVRFLGCTLWTDYDLFNPDGDVGQRSLAMREAALSLNDHKLIRTAEGGLFTPAHAATEHRKSVEWLKAELEKDWDGKTVVITHHAPSDKVINPRYLGSPLNPAFYSSLEYLMDGVDLWIHGHTHFDVDFMVGNCRIVSRQVCYPSRTGNLIERQINGQGDFEPLVVEI